MIGSAIHPSRKAWPMTNAPPRRSGVSEQSCKASTRRTNREEIAVAVARNPSWFKASSIMIWSKQASPTRVSGFRRTSGKFLLYQTSLR